MKKTASKSVTASHIVVQNDAALSEPRLSSLQKRIIAGHRRTKTLVTASAMCALETGRALLEVKANMAHGAFLPWVECHISKECGMSRRTAQRYMKLARNRSELLNRIREIRASGDVAGFDESKAEMVLSTMKLNDALSLLAIGKAQGVRGRKVGQQRGSERECLLTPENVVAALLEFFAEIDLDPCANSALPNHIPAKTCLTIEDDGLSAGQPWLGRVFVHPPEGAELPEWIERCVNAHATGECDEAVLLVPTNTTAAWSPLVDSYPRVYLRDKLKCRPGDGGGRVQAFAATCFLFARDDRFADFARAFNSLGKLFVPFNLQEKSE